MKPTFENTVNILVQAYLNDTLEHGNCTACAVGNIIADACNYKYVPEVDGCCRWNWRGHVPSWYDKNASTNVALIIDCDQTQATGYTVQELEKIEAAFESVIFRDYTEWMFDGLMAVVDVLADIHGVDLSVKENAKLQFVKQ